MHKWTDRRSGKAPEGDLNSQNCPSWDKNLTRGPCSLGQSQSVRPQTTASDTSGPSGTIQPEFHPCMWLQEAWKHVSSNSQAINTFKIHDHSG